jgi:Protein kinase domain/Kelch motif
VWWRGRSDPSHLRARVVRVALPPGWRATAQPAKESGQAWVHQVERDPSDGRLYALKRLKNPERRDRFRREVETMLRLRERGLTVLPEVVAHDLEAARPWFVMPWYDGGSLEEMITGGLFRDNPVGGLSLLIEIAKSFAAIHAEDVAHRDGKPANVLLMGDEIALSDFGLCIQVDEDAERFTSLDEAVGSRLYIAPENESGINEELDQRPADFYAFGKILWATLAGKHPPARERQLQADNRLEEILGDPRYASLRTVQERLLDVDPNSRLGDWALVIGELETAKDRFEEAEAVATDGEELLAAARRLQHRPGLRGLVEQRAATEEEQTWVQEHLVRGLSEAAVTAGQALLQQATQEAGGVLSTDIGSEGNSLINLFNGSPRLAEKVSEGFDPAAYTGVAGFGPPVGYFVQSSLGRLPVRVSLDLYVSLQKSEIWLLAVPVVARGSEWMIPDQLLDEAFMISGPHPVRLEQTVAAAQQFSATAFPRFVRMLQRYMETVTEGADPSDATVWGPVPSFRLTAWRGVDDLIPALSHHAAVVVADELYILGGQREDGPTSAVQILNVQDVSWRPGSPLPAASLQLAATAANDGTLYAIGGLIDDRHSQAVVALALGGADWEQRAPMNLARSDFGAACASDGSLFVVGGLSDQGLLDAVERYLPGEDRWEQVASLRIQRRGCAVAAGSTQIYVAGGRINDPGGVFSADFEVYDLSTGAWSQGPPMLTGRAWCAGTIGSDGRFYVLGGHRVTDPAGGYVKTVGAFDPVSGGWQPVDPLLVARALFAASACGDDLLAVGGEGFGGPVASIEKLVLPRT